jgi:hypothetical protein
MTQILQGKEGIPDIKISDWRKKLSNFKSHSTNPHDKGGAKHKSKSAEKFRTAAKLGLSASQSPVDAAHSLHVIKQKVFKIMKPSVSKLEQSTKAAINAYFKLKPVPTTHQLTNCQLMVDVAMA